MSRDGLGARLAKGLRTFVAALALVSVFVTPVAASPATKGDSVNGVGYRLLDGERRVQYTISVRGGPGGMPIGSFLYRAVAFNLTLGGPVTCIDIDGNKAAIGGRITHVASTDPANDVLKGLSYLVFVEDNGAAGLDIVSQTYILPGDPVDVPSDFPATCPDATSTAHDAFEFDGDLVVVDK